MFCQRRATVFLLRSFDHMMYHLSEHKHSARPGEVRRPLLHLRLLHEHQGRAEDDPRGPGAAHEVAEEELADHQGLVEPAQGVHHCQGLALSGALGGRLTGGSFSLVGSVTSARMPLF